MTPEPEAAEQLRSALQAEYLHLQKTIEDFDARALTIKAWSISFSLASAVAGVVASRPAAVLAVAGASAALFWIIEASWKAFQQVYYRRSLAIEDHFAGRAVLRYPFQIGTTWKETGKSALVLEFARKLVMPHVALPHVLVIAFTLAVVLYPDLVR